MGPAASLLEKGLATGTWPQAMTIYSERLDEVAFTSMRNDKKNVINGAFSFNDLTVKVPAKSDYVHSSRVSRIV